jgi:hypothetical protein
VEGLVELLTTSIPLSNLRAIWMLSMIGAITIGSASRLLNAWNENRTIRLKGENLRSPLNTNLNELKHHDARITGRMETVQVAHERLKERVAEEGKKIDVLEQPVARSKSSFDHLGNISSLLEKAAVPKNKPRPKNRQSHAARKRKKQ